VHPHAIVCLATPCVRSRVIGIQAYGLVVVQDCEDVLADVCARSGSVLVSSYIIRRQRDGPVEVALCCIVVFEVPVCTPSTIVRERALWVQSDRLVVVLDG